MVGDVKEINGEIFEDFIHKGIIPVVCAVTLGTEGELLNTNADTIASEVAKAMSSKFKTHLIYCFEKNGVLTDITNENSLLKTITQQQFNQMKETKQIADGMIPKLQSAYKVLFHGVEEVRIISSGALSSYFENENPGTKILLH